MTPATRAGGAVMDAMHPVPYRVLRVRRELRDVFTIEVERAGEVEPAREVERAGGAPAFAFSPGQFNMLYAFGVGEAPVSISGDPAEGRSIGHTVRSVGNVTRAIYALKRGDTLGLRGPFGTGWPLEAAQENDVLVVAGGIGLAPLRPALYGMFAHRRRYGTISLLYGARNSDEVLYQRELKLWETRFGADIKVTVDQATAAWQGDVGVVTKLIARANFDRLNTVAMVCGPEVMIRFACIELEGLGINPENIFISLERNMKCAIGLCGHCQFGPKIVCRDGPVFAYGAVKHLLGTREL